MGRWLNENLDPCGVTARAPYRVASIALLASVIALIVLTGSNRNMALLPFLIGAPLYLSLVSLTARRLRDAGMSPYWIVWMLLNFRFGPTWTVTPGIVLHPSDALNLLPVVMGWSLRTAVPGDGKGFWFDVGRLVGKLRPPVRSNSR